MKIHALLIGTLLVFLAGVRCANQPTRIGSTETSNGTISGKLVDAHGQPAIGAKVKLLDAQYIPSFSSAMQKRAETSIVKDTVVFTNSTGEYFLPLPDSGTYNIFGETDKGLKVMIASISVKDTTPIKVMTDTVLPPGEIKGVSFLPGQDSINQVRVILAIPGTNYTTIPNIGGAFSFTKVPQGDYRLIFNPTLPQYNVKVMNVSVVSGKVTNLDTVLLAQAIVTGLPKASAGNDTVVSIGDTVRLHGSATNPSGVSLSLGWDIGSTGTFRKTSAGDTTIIMPSTPMIGMPCIFRVMDNSGNYSLDTAVVKVELDAPIVVIVGDSTISLNRPVIFSALTTQKFGKITGYQWNLGAGVSSSLFTSDSTYSVTFTKEGRQSVFLKVMDDDGNIAQATKNVVVASDGPVISGLHDTTITIKDTVVFSIRVTDANGIYPRYYWNFGDKGAKQGDTTFVPSVKHAFPSFAVKCTVSVALTDSSGKAGRDSAIVNVLLDPPVANAGPDTSVSVGANYTIHGSGTDGLGKIVMYRFDTNGDERFEDSSAVSGVKTYKAPSAYGTFSIVVQVEDDDGNRTQDTMVLTVTKLN